MCALNLVYIKPLWLPIIGSQGDSPIPARVHGPRRLTPPLPPSLPRLAAALDPLCALAAAPLDEPWRDPALGANCVEYTAGTCHTDTASIAGYCRSVFFMTNPSGFGAAGGAARVYGLGAGGLGALPLAPPGVGSCGTTEPAWLSAWAGPHVTGDSGDADGGPPKGFAEGMPAGRLPAPGDPALRATACFQSGGGGYECDYHAAVEVAACGGGRLAWRLPPAPFCYAGYCAAAPPAGAAGGGR